MRTRFLHLRFAWIVLLWLPFSLSSCEKDELTQPVEVQFQFKLDRTLPRQESTMAFHSGTMDIQYIQFTGDRTSGEDITFMSDFGTIVRSDLATGNSDPLIKFDIPQGTYSEIKLVVSPDNTLPDLVVMGRYRPVLIGAPVPVQVDVDLAGHLNLIATSPDGRTEVTLRKGSRPTIEIFLNPSLWFANISAATLQTAELQNISGVPSMVISKEFNRDLYAKLTALIQVSAEAVVK